MTYADALFLVGAAVFVAGVALVYFPAAVMLAGAAIAGFAWLNYTSAPNADTGERA